MDFRIENKESFKIIGQRTEGVGGPDNWGRFYETFGKIFDNAGGKSYYKAPLWHVGAYKFIPAGSHFKGTDSDKPKEVICTIGALYDGEQLSDGLMLEEFPASVWAVFPVVSDTDNDATGTHYVRALLEWFPVSNYKINYDLPYLEVYGIPTEPGAVHYDEVWIPVINK